MPHPSDGETPEPPREELTPFDDRVADLRWQDNRWLLHAGNVWLKDFGRREREARDALRLIRELRLNQHGTVGSPQPVLEYWLSDGRAPQGPVQGLRTFPFTPEKLRVAQIDGQWCVRDDRLLLCTFGGNESQARQALAILRHHAFNEVGYIGQPIPTMMFFLIGSGGLTHPTIHVAAPESQANSMLFTGRQLSVPHAPLPGASVIERVPFDWRQARITQENRQWKLMAGSYILADFGVNEQAARQALAIVRHYRFTEHDLVGGSPPVFSYFLSTEQAPQGSFFGTFDTNFRPESLVLRRVGGEVVLTDGGQVLLHFGDKEKAAQAVLQVIQKYHCDRLCRVGSSDSSAMTFLTRVR
jgi:hypothetical protein